MDEHAAHLLRRTELIRDHGKPRTVTDLRLALTLILAPPDVSERDVFASVYRDREAADAWLASNLEHHGHPCLGRYLLPGGQILGVLDLRPSLARMRRLEEVLEDGPPPPPDAP